MLTINSIAGAEYQLKAIRVLSRRKAFRGFFSKEVEVPGEQAAERQSIRICNVVMQGGGVLGLAHVGFICGLEEAGVRFAGVAGTSAGAIVATALVCARGGDINKRVGEDLLRLIADMPMSQFIDGPAAIRVLIKRYLTRRRLLSPSLWPALLMALSRMFRLRGLNPGLEFEVWLTETFSAQGVKSNYDLLEVLRQIHAVLSGQGLELKTLQGVQGKREESADAEDLLKVIATALPAGIKLTFPRDLDLLDGRYMASSPAEFVRASMAIPGFFEPKFLDADKAAWGHRIDSQFGRLASEQQRDDFKHTNPIGFVDGGLLSNLPVDAFRPLRPVPTVVLTLVKWSDSDTYSFGSNAKGLLADVMRLAEAVRLQRDRDAVIRVSGDDYTELVDIDTSEFNWLNFSMAEEEMARLFLSGLERARQFLTTLKGVTIDEKKSEERKSVQGRQLQVA